MTKIPKKGWRLYAQMLAFCRPKPREYMEIVEQFDLDEASARENLRDMACNGVIHEVDWTLAASKRAYFPVYLAGPGTRAVNPATGLLDEPKADRYRPMPHKLRTFSQMVNAMNEEPRTVSWLWRELGLYESEVRSLMKDCEPIGAFRIAGWVKSQGDKGQLVQLWACDGGESVERDIYTKGPEQDLWAKAMAARDLDRIINFAIAGRLVGCES